MYNQHCSLSKLFFNHLQSNPQWYSINGFALSQHAPKYIGITPIMKANIYVPGSYKPNNSQVPQLLDGMIGTGFQ